MLHDFRSDIFLIDILVKKSTVLLDFRPPPKAVSHLSMHQSCLDKSTQHISFIGVPSQTDVLLSIFLLFVWCTLHKVGENLGFLLGVSLLERLSPWEQKWKLCNHFHWMHGRLRRALLGNHRRAIHLPVVHIQVGNKGHSEHSKSFSIRKFLFWQFFGGSHASFFVWNMNPKALQIPLYSSLRQLLQILRITSVAMGPWEFHQQDWCLDHQRLNNFKWPNHECESVLILKRKYQDCKNGSQRIIIRQDNRLV